MKLHHVKRVVCAIGLVMVGLSESLHLPMKIGRRQARGKELSSQPRYRFPR